jgi:hypothetical protein
MKMKNILVFTLLVLCFSACNNGPALPDVSGINLNIRIERFDKDFSAIDTMNIDKELSSLQEKYPSFYPIFILNILGLDSGSMKIGVANFIKQNKIITDAAKNSFQSVETIKTDFEKAFRYVKYYYPDYKVPGVLLFAGPPDAFARKQNGEMVTGFLTNEFLGVGLQFYLGKEFPMYKNQYYIANIAPQYRSRRFDKEFLVADAMKLIADDIYPEKNAGKGLIEQMIEKGKQWWLLDKFLPTVHDSIKTGYTRQQLDWCSSNEGLIWNEIITTEKDLYTRDPLTLQNYLGEAPFTQSLSPSSPGNIGQWVGWQIVKMFAEKNSSLKIDEVLNTDAKKILEMAKYKPK